MNNKFYFVSGIILSPLVLGFLWLLNSKTPEVQETKQAVQKSLASIDFVPSPTKKPASDISFFQLSLEDAGSKLPKKLSEFSGKPVILHFWATWCAACVEELPELDQFAQKYGEDAHIVVVASDKTQGQAVREFYQKNKINNLTVYIDDNGKLARDFNITALPTTIFISSNSNEMGKIIGPVNWVGESGQIVSQHLNKKNIS